MNQFIHILKIETAGEMQEHYHMWNYYHY